MKHVILALMALCLLLSLSACGSKTEVTDTPEGSSSSALKQDYENALPSVTQLMVGTFRLEGTDNAVNAEQAKELLPLWKAYRSMSSSDSASAAEIASLQEDIEAAMTTDQIQAIAAMKLSREDMTAVMAEQGIEMPTGQFGDLTEEQMASLRAAREAGGGGGGFPGGGAPAAGAPARGGFDGGPGGGQAPDPERLTTLRAQGGGRMMGGSMAQSPLYDALVKLLESKV